jgi:Uma2 family endonuclease
MATAIDLGHRSLDEFLAWERAQPERWERVAGVVRMMTGGTINHNRITLNVADALRQHLRGGSCETFVSDVKVVSPGNDVMYPDVVVACGDIPGHTTKLEAPVVVVEVLSDSTASRDHGPKRWAYQTIPSLRHYVLIAQDAPTVEVASRDPDGTWRSVIHRSLDARLQLAALDLDIGLDEIFARVALSPASSEPSPAPPSSAEA